MKRVWLALAVLVAACGGPADVDDAPAQAPQGLFGGVLSGPGGLSSVVTSSPMAGNGLSGSPVTLSSSGMRVADAYVWNGTQFIRTPITTRPQLTWEFRELWNGATCSTGSPSSQFTGLATGGATVTCNVMEAGGLQPRMLNISTGTGANDGHRGLTNGPTAQFGTTTAPLIQRCLQWGVKATNVGTSVDWYAAHLGFSEPTALTTESVDAVEAVADVKNNGAFWALQTAQNNGGGSNTTIKKCDGTGGTTALPIMAGTAYDLMLCVDATGSNASLNYSLDEGDTYTPCATVTTNIPQGNGRVTGYGWQVFNQAGSAPISQLVQFLYVYEAAVFDSVSVRGRLSYSLLNAGNLTIADNTGEGRQPMTVQVPATFNKDPFRLRPLVMIVSSRGIAVSTLQNQYGLNNLATDMDAIVVLVNGKTGTQINSWHENEACCWRNTDGAAPNDSNFLGGVPALVKSKGWPVNLKAVYSIDEGGGGGVMYRAACDHPDVFAAMIDVNGAMVSTFEGTGDVACPPNTTQILGVVHVHGDADSSPESFSGLGGANAGMSNQFRGTIDTGGTMDQLRDFAGCSGSLNVTAAAPADMSNDIVGVDTTYLTYTNCPTGREVQLWRIAGDDHTFIPTPGSGGGLSVFESKAISFFNAHVKP